MLRCGLMLLVLMTASCTPPEDAAPQSKGRTAPPLPKTFAVATTDEALQSTYGLASVIALSYPQYPTRIKALVTRDHDGFELAFYQCAGDQYQMIDTSTSVIGCALPSVSVEPKSGLPALRAQMIELPDDAYYFFVRNGKVESDVEHPEKWIMVKKPTK